MLRKEQTERPTIEEIIYSNQFQQKCTLQKVHLPLVLNKAKIMGKVKMGQASELLLSP